MSLGDSWGLISGSSSKLNKMTVISGTGAYLASLSLSDHTLLRCTSTGSGFTINHLYLTTEDGTGKIDLTNIASHTHFDNTSGGSFGKVAISASSWFDTWSQMMTDVDTAYWTSGTSGTGATTNITNYTGYDNQMVAKCSTGATSGSGANWKLSGLPPDYTKDRAQFTAIANLSSTSSISARYGYGMETPTASDDNNRKFGFSVCTATNGNWFARTADGDSRSESDMGVAFTTNDVNLTAQCRGDTNDAIFYVDFANLLTKSSDVPIDSVGNNDPLFRFGVKNSTGADRIAYLIKLRLQHYTTSNWW